MSGAAATGVDGARPARDTGRHCPGCLYNLTGIPAVRCPECGVELIPLAVDRQRPPADHGLFYAIATIALAVAIALALGILLTA